MKHALKVINLFGTSGSGKSTVSAGIFHELNNGKHRIEMISEYAKELVWQKRHPSEFDNQISITANQHNKQLYLTQHAIDLCITDSPLLLGHLYTPNDYYTHYSLLLDEMFGSFDNINFLLKRTDFAFDPTGRNQTEAQSNDIHERLVSMLDDKNIPFYLIKSSRTAHLEIIDILSQRKIIGAT